MFSMAATIPVVLTQPSPQSPLGPPKLTSIKTLVESQNLTSNLSAYAFTSNPDEPPVSAPEAPIPAIDFSLLTIGAPEQRSKIIHDLGKACQEWGCFMVINHGVHESLMKAMIGACDEFFNLKDGEKQEYQGKHVLDPIRCGTSHDTFSGDVLFWKDYLKVHIHPQFHSPNKPNSFRNVLSEYCKASRTIALELLKGISESLGLEEHYIHKTMNLEKGFQVFVANFYPPCPQPEHAMGQPPHSDHGLLTLLIQNGVGGLQMQLDGKWVKFDPMPSSILVIVGDHLEIMSNGKYKGVVHRAVVNNQVKRISIAIAHGPLLDTIVKPADEMVDDEHNPPAYNGMKYRDYLELKRNRPLNKKFGLDCVRIEKYRKG